MFRKSVSFFILLALFWILLWQFIPDKYPNKFNWFDLIRAGFIISSLMSFGFALLMLTIRYKGVNLISRFIPHAGVIIWLGKHAYQYSQPKLICTIIYQGPANHLSFVIEAGEQLYKNTVMSGHSENIDLGVITKNPSISWVDNKHITHKQELEVMRLISRIGRNIKLNATINGAQIKINSP